MVAGEVVSQHAEEAAFLWTMRDRAVDDPAHSLDSLAALDERLEAHLDGLRIAGDEGWTCCRANLRDVEAGDVFPLAVLAFGAGDRERMLEVLKVGCVSPDTRRGLVSGLGWLEYDTVYRWIGKLLVAATATYRLIGTAACGVRREDPGALLGPSVSDPDPLLRARALRAVGEFKRRDLLNHVREHVNDEDEACRFWAAWTLTLHRDRAGLLALMPWIRPDHPSGERALQVALRAMTLDEGRQFVRTTTGQPDGARLAIMAAGALGDPACVPWLIDSMQVLPLARAAGSAFSMITGADLETQDLAQPGPERIEDADQASPESVPGVDGDPDQPWPQPSRVGEWWKRHERDFQSGVRYLGGEPASERAVRRLLVTGNQRLRAAAAIELAVRLPDEVLFEVRAPASEQRRRLRGSDVAS